MLPITIDLSSLKFHLPLISTYSYDYLVSKQYGNSGHNGHCFSMSFPFTVFPVQLPPVSIPQKDGDLVSFHLPESLAPTSISVTHLHVFVSRLD